MKKILTLALLVLSTLTISAQHQVYVWNSDKTVTVSGNQVDSITFSVPSSIIQLQTGDASNITTTSMAVTNTTTTEVSFSGAVEEGICYSSTNQEPTVSDSKQSVATSISNGSWDATINGLTAGTTYYYRSYAIIGSNTIYGTTKQFTTNAGAPAPEYVDLGLSVKWATYNLGASKPEEYGNYYAWGETSPKETYTKDNNKYYSSGSWTKYGKDDILEESDDAATQTWGTGWRMPTKADWDELLNTCTCVWTTQDGINGYKITGTNGNSIFLPAGGQKKDNATQDLGVICYYWSSKQYSGYAGDAYDLGGSNTTIEVNHYGRYRGFPIRPVHE